MKLLISALLSAAFVFAQSTNTGQISGSIFDAASGRPIPGVKISIAGQSSDQWQTDTDGRFSFPIAPGTYNITFSNAAFNDATVEAVIVKAGETAEASTVMSSKGSVTTLDVNERVDAVAANAEAALTERRLAATVSDSISADEIRKTVASDAAGAVEKVTGVSIVDSGYVYVRGLGERYSSTMLNNAMIPTTEPEKRVVPLDLFPASLIDSIKVLKTYSPDLPGEFSGGLVQMRTIEFPTQRVFKVSAGTGFNTVTTFNSFGSYTGGGRDFFGFDDGARGLPGVIPTDGRLIAGRYTDAQFQTFGRSFANNWALTPNSSMRPSLNYSMVGGDSFFKGRLGIVGALTFTNQPQRTREEQRYLRTGLASRPVVFTNYDNFESSVEGVRMGGVLNLAYKFSPANKVVFRNTLTRDSDKEGRVFRGYNGGLDSVIESTRLRWVERSILSHSVEGEHAIAKLGNTLINWQFTYSRSRRDEPDFRETVRGQEAGGAFSYLPIADSGFRLFTGLQDKIYEPLAEISKPFYKGSIGGLFKAGFRGTFRDRDFAARRFRFVPVRTQTLNFNLPSNELFGPSNIRPDGFVVREITRGTDTYDAAMDVYAGFAMLDMTFGPKWRVISGVRVEDARINVSTIDPLVPGSRPSNAALNNRDPLPAVNVIYALTPRQNLRFGFGRTVNRPDFRELSPFEFTNVLGGYATAGNPNLLRARIDNYDARWEWFPGGDQVIAASYFFKNFTSPIESVFTPTTAELRQSFVNADGARNQGVELEFRRNLGNFRPALKTLSLQANLTVVKSNVKIPTALAPQLTSTERPLMGQSRLIFNIIVDWTKPDWRSNARFFVNSVSRRLTDVGTFRLPDIYQERNTFLDFVYQYDIKESGKWSLRFSAENLTDNQYRWTQADIVQRAFKIGRTFSVGMSVSVF